MSKAALEKPSPVRETLVARVLGFVSDRPAEELARVERELDQVLDEAGPEALDHLFQRLTTTGAAWTYYAPDPLARRIQDALAKVALPADAKLTGVEHLDALRGADLVFLPNHLSYADANLFVLLLERFGYADVARRTTVIVGPKVYSDTTRRFFSLCFGTIKTPQSTTRSSEDAVMPARAVAQLARDTIAVAQERQRSGDALLVFVEGTRSRTRAMQRALPAVKRYFEQDGSVLVPVGICGSENMVPVGEERLHSTDISMRIGKPVSASALDEAAAGNRTLSMDAVGIAIARLLPESYRGVYAEGVEKLDEARDVADRLFGPNGDAE